MNYSGNILQALLCAILLLWSLDSGADEPRNENSPVSASVPSSVWRDDLKKIYNSAFDHNPSLLAMWDYHTWSVIGVEGQYGKGRLHAPQSPDGMAGIRVNTESILHQKKSGWTFSGKFEYSIGFTDSLRSTLSYRDKPYGSPSFFYCTAPADKWEVQQYSLSATASRRLGQKWLFGAQLDYDGGKQFRKSDVRNEQTTLSIDLTAGVSYVLGGTEKSSNVLTAGLSYERNKEAPSFSRIYSSGADYVIYLMNGLGTQVSNLAANHSWTQNVPGANLGWTFYRGDNRIYARYLFKYGSDGWKSTATESATKQSKISKYTFVSHGLNVTDARYLGADGKLVFDLNADYVSGKSSNLNKTTSLMVQDCNISLFNAEIAARYVSSGLLRMVGVEAVLSGQNDLDKNYDARFKCFCTNENAFVALGRKFGKIDITLGLDGGISLNPSVEYTPNAAKDGTNLYTTYVGRAKEQWLNTDRWRVGAKLGIEIPAGKTLVNAGLRFTHESPFSVSDTTYQATKWQEGRLSLAVVF